MQLQTVSVLSKISSSLRRGTPTKPTASASGVCPPSYLLLSFALRVSHIRLPFRDSFPSILGTDLSRPATFLCPLGIRHSFQSLHIPTKRFAHSATPCCPNRQRRGRGHSGSYADFAVLLSGRLWLLLGLPGCSQQNTCELQESHTRTVFRRVQPEAIQ